VGLERVLSLTRKYGLSLTLGCQVFGQIPAELRAALGQATFIGFRMSRQDANWAAEMVTTVNRERVKYTASGHPTYMSATEQRAEWEDMLCSLPPRQAVLRVGEQTIRFQTLGIPPAQSTRGALEQVKDHYARLYLTPRAQVEQFEVVLSRGMGTPTPGSAQNQFQPSGQTHQHAGGSTQVSRRRVAPLPKKTP
jgi:hypothetical protein